MNALFLWLVLATLTMEVTGNIPIVIKAKNLDRKGVSGVTYGNFRKHDRHRLSPRNVYQVISYITKPVVCAKSCLNEAWCWSFNLKRQTYRDGFLLCEILSTHKYDNPIEFLDDGEFDHYSIENLCDDGPCKHGGKCSPLYNEDDYNCSCVQGFTGKQCQQDIDECSVGSHNCHSKANCINTHGSHNCTCKDGFKGNGVQCTDIDECSVGSHNCHSKANCINTHGSHNCTCKDGFKGNGVQCTDIDECVDGKHNCQVNAFCNNIVGSFECLCKQGFNREGSECKDIDECSVGSHNCHSNASCINTHGSHNCTCKDGFKGNGVQCTDIDECAEDKHNCQGDSVCYNTVGSFKCTCKPGFNGEPGSGCTDIDECSVGSHNCHSKATCTNTHGSHNCTCNSGFKGNGVQCTEIDQCQLLSCGEDAECKNGRCTCKKHFIGDGILCKDVTGACKYLSYTLGLKSNGVYRVRAKHDKSYLAYCQMENDSGGNPWTVFQRRKDGSTPFNKTMHDYKKGFGDPDGEFWLGLDALHEFSKKEFTDENGHLRLLVEMEDWEGHKTSATYTDFEVKEGADKHKMEGSFASGTAGDSLKYHLGQGFSAVNEDNDGTSDKHCGEEFQAGWWFKECPPDDEDWSNLNGKYMGQVNDQSGIIWTTFKEDQSLKFTEMKFQKSN